MYLGGNRRWVPLIYKCLSKICIIQFCMRNASFLELCYPSFIVVLFCRQLVLSYGIKKSY